MKKILLLSAFIFMTVSSLKADLAPGTWVVHPSFVGPGQKVLETSRTVFFLTGNSLFSFDKNSEEMTSYVYDNPLYDWDIDDIYLSTERGFVVVAYKNGNIDVISRNGEILNISDIKNGLNLDDRFINDIAFDGNTAYIATGFGLVKADLSSGKIQSSGRFGKNVSSVAVSDGKLLVICEGKLLSADKDVSINRLDNFNEISEIRPVDEFYAFSPESLMLRSGGLISFGVVEGRSFNEYDWLEIVDKPFIYGEDGIYAVLKDGNLWKISYDGSRREIIRKIDIPSPDVAIGGRNMEQEYWIAGREGIGKKVYSDGGWISESGSFIPADALTARSIDLIIPGSKEERIYFGNLGATLYRNGSATDALETVQQLALLEGGTFLDKSAENVVGEFDNVKWQQTVHGNVLITPERFCENPAETDVYFIGTGNDGLYKIKGRDFVGRYAGANSPISSPWGYRVFEASIDRGGNLWIGYDGTGAESGVAVLPADKLSLAPQQITKADWKEIDIKGMPVDRDMRIFHCKFSPVTFIFNWDGEDGLIAVNNGGTPQDLSDDTVYFIHRLVDQDGGIFTPERFTAIAEDRNGHVWIGCEGGLIEIADPTSATDSQLTVRRVKISHDDGTGLADYFGSTDRIMDISVDGANRKWIATAESGLYLMNPTCNTVISNFTTKNSPLPSNEVRAVYAEPIGNSVYIGTASGLVEYGSNASAPQDDFSNIKVYPNPIGPRSEVDFVTISGLTDGAEVKITDTVGGFVWQGRAEGGLAQWNLENFSGKRVASGVYYVFLSSENSGHAVAKIMIIN